MVHEFVFIYSFFFSFFFLSFFVLLERYCILLSGIFFLVNIQCERFALKTSSFWVPPHSGRGIKLKN